MKENRIYLNESNRKIKNRLLAVGVKPTPRWGLWYMAKLKDFENPVLKASGSGSRGQIYHIPEERPVKHPIPTCSSRKANNYNIFERAVLEERSFHEPCSRCYGLDGEGDLGKRADYSCPSCGHNTLETDSAKANFVCENCGERVREVVYDE